MCEGMSDFVTISFIRVVAQPVEFVLDPTQKLAQELLGVIVFQ